MIAFSQVEPRTPTTGMSTAEWRPTMQPQRSVHSREEVEAVARRLTVPDAGPIPDTDLISQRPLLDVGRFDPRFRLPTQEILPRSGQIDPIVPDGAAAPPAAAAVSAGWLIGGILAIGAVIGLIGSRLLARR